MSRIPLYSIIRFGCSISTQKPLKGRKTRNGLPSLCMLGGMLNMCGCILHVAIKGFGDGEAESSSNWFQVNRISWLRPLASNVL